MHTKPAAILAGVAMMGVAGGTAAAQSAPTCSFDAASATVTVTINGVDAEVRAVETTGAIKLNGVACGGATVTNTDSIQIQGGALYDTAIVSGNFAPGLTPELDGNSEIEIALALGLDDDRLELEMTSAADRVYFTSKGIDLGGDLDEDISLIGVRDAIVDGRGGNDIINASAYTRPRGVDLIGGPGDDRLVGTDFTDGLFGEAGNDQLFGGDDKDFLHPGLGDDIVRAGAGADYIFAEDSLDGRDEIYGSGGRDLIHYGGRLAPVTVILNNGLADDGEAGENDLIEGVERVVGGQGDDLIVGTDDRDDLSGASGDDEIYGGGGDDLLTGDRGADILLGDAGSDQIFGYEGTDSIDGGGGADELHGGDANDLITGGPGHDDIFGEAGEDIIYNAGDNMLDRVDCGDGTADDAEPDPLDTFTSCEL